MTPCFGVGVRLCLIGPATGYQRAVMDLGATLCTPRQPDHRCPCNPTALLTLQTPTAGPDRRPKPLPFHVIGGGCTQRGWGGVD